MVARPGRRKPTRRDLLLVIGELQNLVGKMSSAYGNDRAECRASQVNRAAEKALTLCIDARSFDPPIQGGSRNGWPYPQE